MYSQDTTSILPLTNDQKKLVDDLLHHFNDKQLTWLAGYLTGVTLPNSLKLFPSEKQVLPPETNLEKETFPITVLYGSRTGNGASIAKALKQAAENTTLRINLLDMNEYPNQQLKDEKVLLIIVSTHGEGDPPLAAEGFYNYLLSNRAPKLSQTSFAVLALGDSSYLNFCKTGKDIDSRLEALGAHRILERVDCDIDMAVSSETWINNILQALHQNTPSPKVTHSEGIRTANSSYHKQNPFPARILEKIKLNGKGSSKETYHYEISLENSGLQYEPGDAIGIYPENPPLIVHDILQQLQLDPDTLVQKDNVQKKIQEYLIRDYELSLLTPDMLGRYNEYAKSPSLTTILNDSNLLQQFVFKKDLTDVLNEYPVKLTAEELLKILRK